MTAFNSKEGGYYFTTVGRVRTPRSPSSRTQGEDPLLHAEELLGSPREVRSKAANIPRAGSTRSQEGRRRGTEGGADLERGEAKAIATACRGKTGITRMRDQAQLSLLYDLTRLQRKANGTLRLPGARDPARSARRSMNAIKFSRIRARNPTARGLHRHGQELLESLTDVKEFAPFAKQIAKQGWVKPNKRIFDNSKISDHFAIIPTLQVPKQLNEAEHKLYDMVVRRFLAVFYPPPSRCRQPVLHASASTTSRPRARLLNPGWLAVYGRAGGEENREPAGRREGREGQGRGSRRAGESGPSRRRATAKPRCSRPWKARASWSTTTKCARQWAPGPRHASDARRDHRRPDPRGVCTS